MFDLSTLFTIALGAILVNNFVLAKFLGLCPFIGVSQKTENAVGMGMAVTFVMTMASAITYLIYAYILQPGASNLLFKAGLIQIDTDLSPVLRTVSYILVIATMVQLVEMFMRKFVPALYQSLGIYLPLITTNCAVLGVAIINIQEGFSLLQTIVFSAASAAGFGLALVLFAGIRERFEIIRVPKQLQGTGIGLVTAGLLALSFFAFKGMI